MIEETYLPADPETAWQPSGPRINSVTVAIVTENIDAEGQGRVKLRFPWMLDVEPWARVCAPVAGDHAGIFAIPQVDDEVLVAFAHGDVMQPYVLGGLWSMSASPPAPLPTDSQTKRVIRSPSGHTITLDDLPPAITIEHAEGHKIELTAEGITLSTVGGASVKLSAEGEIKVQGTTTVEVKGAEVTVEAQAAAKVSGNASLELSATGPCTIAGLPVKIN